MPTRRLFPRTALVVLLAVVSALGANAQWPQGPTRPGSGQNSTGGGQQSSAPVMGDNSISVHVAGAGGIDLPRLVHVELQFDSRSQPFMPGYIGGDHTANLTGDLYKDGYCDARGYYSFAALPDGAYRLTVSAAGYLPSWVDVTLSHAAREQVPVQIRPTPDTVDYAPDSGIVSVDWLAVPEKARKKYQKARECLAKQDFNGAIKQLHEALGIDSGFVYAYNQLGLAYWNTGKLPEAKETFERAIAVNPKFLQASLNLGELLISQKQYPDAARVLQQVSEKQPTAGEPYYLMAKLQFAVGNVDRAESACQEAVKRDVSRTPEIHLLLSNIYARKQETDKVARELQAYLSAAPQGRYSKAARENLDKIRLEQAREGTAAPANGTGSTTTTGDSPQ